MGVGNEHASTYNECEDQRHGRILPFPLTEASTIRYQTFLFTSSGVISEQAATLLLTFLSS